MPEGHYTVADIVKLRDEPLGGIIQDTARSFPLYGRLPAATVPKTTYNQPLVTELPKGVFRGDNEGKKSSKARTKTVPVELQYFDGSMGPLDVKVARGDSNGVAAACTFATEQAMLGLANDLERQIIWGGQEVHYMEEDNETGELTPAVMDLRQGFTGLCKNIPKHRRYDAGGRTEYGCSDVFLVCFDLVKLILGNDGTLRSSTEVDFGLVTAPDGGTYYAYSQEIGGYVCITRPTANSVFRIANLDATKTLNDTLIHRAMAACSNGYEYSAIFMTKDKREQLRNSRTATNPTGAPAPLPENVGGVPIFVTSSIPDTMQPTIFA